MCEWERLMNLPRNHRMALFTRFNRFQRWVAEQGRGEPTAAISSNGHLSPPPPLQNHAR